MLEMLLQIKVINNLCGKCSFHLIMKIQVITFRFRGFKFC